MNVAALFVRADSIYKTLPGVDCYDIERDARTFQGGMPVVAHPPCRAWGKLWYFAKPRPDEKNLGRLAVALVREFGGVLEHPKDSKLWDAQAIPRPGQAPDAWGGWTLPISQHWFGHRAEKLTWLYIVGCPPGALPIMPMRLGEATHVIAQSRMRRKDGTRLRKSTGNPALTGWRPEVTKAEREHTPPRSCPLARRSSQALRTRKETDMTQQLSNPEQLPDSGTLSLTIIAEALGLSLDDAPEHCGIGAWLAREIRKLRPAARAQPASGADGLPQAVEQMAINRYRPVPSGVIAYKVVAGDGDRRIFSGTKDECHIVARKLTEAFLDGAHVALQDHAARQPSGNAGELPSGAVAYLDLGAGGYMDVGTDLQDEQLATLPRGRHMLGIIGTYGVDGYEPAAQAQPPVSQPVAADPFLRSRVAAVIAGVYDRVTEIGEATDEVIDLCRAALAPQASDDIPYPYLPDGLIIATRHHSGATAYRAEMRDDQERLVIGGAWQPTRQAATAEAWAIKCDLMRHEAQQAAGQGGGNG